MSNRGPHNLPRDDTGTLRACSDLGGYTINYHTADGGMVCPDCARMAEREGLSADPDDPQWYIIHADIYWEGPDMRCVHCNGIIESEYGGPESDE